MKKRWKLYHYKKGLVLEEQPTCILEIGDRVIVKDLDDNSYEIHKVYEYTVTLVNTETGTTITVHISDIEMVYC